MRPEYGLIEAVGERSEEWTLSSSQSPGRTSDQRDAEPRADGVSGGSAEQTIAALPESETERWKRLVEAEARERLKRNIRHVADKDQPSHRQH
jgi:hypothetical protein